MASHEKFLDRPARFFGLRKVLVLRLKKARRQETRATRRRSGDCSGIARRVCCDAGSETRPDGRRLADRFVSRQLGHLSSQGR